MEVSSGWGLSESRRPEIAPLRFMLESQLEPLYNIGRKKDAGEVIRDYSNRAEDMAHTPAPRRLREQLDRLRVHPGGPAT